MKRLALATLGLSLALAASQPALAAPARVDSLCTFDRPIQYSVSVSPLHPCSGQPLSLVVKGCQGCDVPIFGVFADSGGVSLRFDVHRYCLDVACVPESIVVPIGAFQAGTHTLTLQITAYVVDAFPDSSCVVTQTDQFTFSVGDSCPPPPTGLPFVTRVQIGAPPPCIECPPRICAGDSIPVLIQGVFPNDCWDVFAVRVDSTLHQVPFVRLVVARKVSTNCLIPTERPFEAAVMMPGRPQGPSELLVEEDWVTVSSPGIPDSVFQAVFPFTVSEPCSTVTPPPPATFVRTVTVGRAPCAGCPALICPGDSIPVWVSGVFPDACWQFAGIELLPTPYMNPFPYPPIVRVKVYRDSCMDPACATVMKPFAGAAMMPPLPSGSYELWVEEAHDVPCDSMPGQPMGFTVIRLPDVPFAVAPTCSATTSLPFVTMFHVGPLLRDPCPRCEVALCPGDSIPVQVAGILPDNCWRFDGLVLLEQPIYQGPGPRPPIVRIRVSRNDCLRIACDQVPVPFAAAINLPPLPAGGYTLQAEESWGSWCDPIRIDSLFRALVPFVVSPSCTTGVGPGCQMVYWPREDWNPVRCDAIVSSLHPALLDMGISTDVPLAGIQGDIHMTPPGLHITQLAPIGAAEGWSLVWQPTADGARFVLFGTGGQVIAPPSDSAWVLPGQRILRITAAEVAGSGPPAPRTTVYATLLASDPHGNTVPPCPTLVIPTATICYGTQACDLNRDGTPDIRDLVLMVNCLLGRSGWCPDSSLAALDCNGDGLKSLDDVMCCAGIVLRGGMPDTTHGRPEPSVQVGFGAPLPTTRGIDVVVRIDGADRLGAARLALRYPSDRFDVLSVEGADDRWLCLHQVSGSDLTVGLISLDLPTGGAQSAPSLSFTLHLALKPGQQIGGELKLASGEFSGPDGAALQVSLLPTSVPAGGATRAMLSAAQPNPFSSGTRFAVTLPRAADVELAVYDLAGRRMATVYRGRVEAGTRAFSWSGARDDGTRAPDGAYFLRLRAGGEDATRKVVFLRGR